MKRNSIAILVLFADEEMIDNYVFYLADKIRCLADKLVITVNGTVDIEYSNRLYEYADEIFFRNNSGLDCGAFKDTLEKYVGWKKICQYDELILVNDSCYGPIYPLSKVFDAMDKKKLDFWGITEQTPIKAGRYSEELLPHHIQSYFLVVRKRMLHSDDFQDFWSRVEPSDDYGETVVNFELKFTRFFTNLNYVSGAYIDCGAFCKSVEETQAYIFMDSFRLISEHKCPFIKKKVFLFPHKVVLASNAGETAAQSLKYIQEHTEYDEDLILQHLIRKCNVNDMRVALHLDYCVSTEKRLTCKKISDVMVIIFFASLYLVEKCISYIKRLPEYIDLTIIAYNKNDKNVLKDIIGEKIKVKKYIEWKNVDDFIDLERLISEYEYVGFVYNKENSDLNNDLAKESYFDLIWENILSNATYIRNVLYILESNVRLGFLCPPAPYMANAFTVSSQGYNRFDIDIKYICNILGLQCNIDNQNKYFSYGNAYWCKKNALKPLFEMNRYSGKFYEELFKNPDIYKILFEKLYPYIAQKQGYYSGTIMTVEYASVYACNYHYMLSGIIKNVLLDRGIQEFRNVRKINTGLMEFCHKYNKIYLYGAGECGNECLVYLQIRGVKVESFIVSDGNRINNATSGIRIMELSEIEIRPDMGIILALGLIHAKVVGRLLEERGIHNYIQYEV